MAVIEKKHNEAPSQIGIKLLVAALCLWVAAGLSFMAAMSISMALLVLAGLAYFFYFRGFFPSAAGRFLLHSTYTKVTIALLLAAIGSVVFAYFFPPLGIPAQGFHELPKKLGYFLLPPFLALVLISLAEQKNTTVAKLPFWPVLFGMSFFVAVLGILQFWGSWLFPKEWLEWRFFRPVAWSRHYHAQGLMFFHLSYASALCFSLAYGTARFFWRPVEDSKRRWLWHGVVALLSALAIYYSFSRISWVAIIAVIFLLGFLRRKQLGYILLLLIGVGGLSLWVLDHDFRQRALDVVGMEGRVIVWRNSWEMVKDRPFTGVGFGKTGQYSEEYSLRVFGKEQWFASHAHNNILDALAATGIIGFITHLLWWAVLLVYAWRAYRSTVLEQKWLPAALFIGGLAFQINGLTQVNFFDAKSQHSLSLWVALVLALEWQRRRQIQNKSLK